MINRHFNSYPAIIISVQNILKLESTLKYYYMGKRTSCDEHLPDRTSLSVQEIVRLLSLCLSATYLSFCGEHYQQIFGTAMGSSLCDGGQPGHGKCGG